MGKGKAGLNQAILQVCLIKLWNRDAVIRLKSYKASELKSADKIESENKKYLLLQLDNSINLMNGKFRIKLFDSSLEGNVVSGILADTIKCNIISEYFTILKVR